MAARKLRIEERAEAEARAALLWYMDRNRPLPSDFRRQSKIVAFMHLRRRPGYWR
jgi:hypothetical protein